MSGMSKTHKLPMLNRQISAHRDFVLSVLLYNSNGAGIARMIMSRIMLVAVKLV